MALVTDDLPRVTAIPASGRTDYPALAATLESPGADAQAAFAPSMRYW